MSSDSWRERLLNDNDDPEFTSDPKSADGSAGGPAIPADQPGETEATESIPGERSYRAVLQRFADVPAELLRWLWPGRVPLGMLTVLSGNPGGGKTFVVADLVARITTGRAFPDGQNANGPGDVLFMNLEDHVRVTQKPRLVAADADLDRVVRIECVEVTTPDGVVANLSFHAGTAAESIRSTAKQLSDLRLVVIDPLAALLASCRSNDAGDVREALAPLVSVAEDLGVALVLVHHNRKGSGTHASERMSGSIQIGATVRMVWEFFRDENDDERRLFLPGKNSNARDCSGLAFRVVDSPVVLSDAGDFVGRVEWESGNIAMSADEAADRQRDTDGGDPFAVEWLRDYIGTGTVAATEAIAESRKLGITDKQIRNARKALKIKSEKSSFAGGWSWSLPTD